ncbi:unnamed protein product, partial [marine sediment metagenome]
MKAVMVYVYGKKPLTTEQVAGWRDMTGLDCVMLCIGLARPTCQPSVAAIRDAGATCIMQDHLLSIGDEAQDIPIGTQRLAALELLKRLTPRPVAFVVVHERGTLAPGVVEHVKWLVPELEKLGVEPVVVIEWLAREIKRASDLMAFLMPRSSFLIEGNVWSSSNDYVPVTEERQRTRFRKRIQEVKEAKA